MQKLPIKIQVALSFCTLAVSACGTNQSGNTYQPKLIGGSAAEAVALDSFLSIPSCSGVLVSPTVVMTAAHCIHEFSTTGRIKSMYDPGRNFSVSNGQVSLQVKVLSAHIHPSWEKACTAARPCDPKRAGAGNDPAVSDLAVIRLAEPVTAIPHAVLDLDPTPVGAPVRVAGYGCESGINTGASGNRKAMVTVVADGEKSLRHQGSQRLNAISQTLSANFVTPGRSDGGPSLCPGDSGGPVYRDFSAEEKRRIAAGEKVPGRLVAINADYTFSGEYEALGAVAKTNIHARFDAPQVRQWLADLVSGPQSGGSSNTADKDIYMFLPSDSSSAVEVYIAAAKEVTEVTMCRGNSVSCTEPERISFRFHSEKSGRQIFKNILPAEPIEGVFTIAGMTQSGNLISKQTVRIAPK